VSSTDDDFPRVRTSYDALANDYAAAYGDELAHNPLHRGIVDCFATLVASSRLHGPVGDVGCGPGHVAAHLAARDLPVVGIDLSPAMIEVARRRHPGLDFRVGTMTRLDTPDASWAGLAAIHSIIHLPRADRERAYAEMARVLRPGAWILVSFHVDSAKARPGDSIHLDEFLGCRVDLDGYFLAPEEVAAGLNAAGIRLEARFDREPWPDLEYPSRRSYLLGRRGAT